MLIKQETSQVIFRKLLHILEDTGVQQPIALDTTQNGVASKFMQVHIANSSDCIYLPAAKTKNTLSEELQSRGYDTCDDTDLDSVLDDVNSQFSGSILGKKLKTAISPNYLTTKLETEGLIPHLFAVIVEVGSEGLSLGSVQISFSSEVSTGWPNQDYRESLKEESYKIASHSWNLELSCADYFISNVNSNERVDRQPSWKDLANRTVTYRLAKSKSSTRFLSEFTMEHKAGLYLFLLPIILPSNIPATVKTVNGSLSHRLSVEIPFKSDSRMKGTSAKAKYELPMVRTAPSIATSISDKPIHISRLWNDSLHYVIAFPRKFASLGSEHIINVKLVPVLKDIVLKRIKFNILEKITYLSEDLSKEYDYDGGSNCGLQLKVLRNKDRVIPLCELRTKQKSSNYILADPFKEEVIKCPNNNLLNACYEPSSNSSDSKEVVVASPLDINVALPFLTSEADKKFFSNGIDLSSSVGPPRKRIASGRADLFSNPEVTSSSIIGSLETQVRNQATPMNETELKSSFKINSSHFASRQGINKDEGSTAQKRALSPDSNFKHIQVSHRLQVSFRISRPEAKDKSKVRHYEIAVDTPLVLLSSKCNDESTQLPSYEESSAMPLPILETPKYSNNGISIRQLEVRNGDRSLPSFEEAMSSSSSPLHLVSLGSSVEVPPLHLTNRLDSAPAFDPARFYFRHGTRDRGLSEAIERNLIPV